MLPLNHRTFCACAFWCGNSIINQLRDMAQVSLAADNSYMEQLLKLE
jgi:hypothetical protein